MANSDRKIIHGVHLGSKLYVPGMEDELDAALPASDVARLIEQGSLEGKWIGKSDDVDAKADTSKKGK